MDAGVRDLETDIVEEIAEGSSVTAPAVYLLRDVRDFVSRRSYFLVGDGPEFLLSADEYADLRAEKLALSWLRSSLIRAFIRGYECAKS